jgi:hypothetical protein
VAVAGGEGGGMVVVVVGVLLVLIIIIGALQRSTIRPCFSSVPSRSSRAPHVHTPTFVACPPLKRTYGLLHCIMAAITLFVRSGGHAILAQVRATKRCCVADRCGNCEEQEYFSFLSSSQIACVISAELSRLPCSLACRRENLPHWCCITMADSNR